MVFNPGSPVYRRKVFVASVHICTVAGLLTSLSDYGTQDHIFQPWQKFVLGSIDKFYHIKDDELSALLAERKNSKINKKAINQNQS